MLGRPEAVREQDRGLPGPTGSRPLSEAQRGLAESKTKGGRVPGPPHFWLKQKGTKLSKDCGAFSIPVSGGRSIKDSRKGVHARQSGTFRTPGSSHPGPGPRELL